MSISTVAVTGLQNAQTRIVKASENIARLGEEAGAEPQAKLPTIEDSLVDIELATYDYKANLRVLKADKEIGESLLDIVS